MTDWKGRKKKRNTNEKWHQVNRLLQVNKKSNTSDTFVQLYIVFITYRIVLMCEICRKKIRRKQLMVVFECCKENDMVCLVCSWQWPYQHHSKRWEIDRIERRKTGAKKREMVQQKFMTKYIMRDIKSSIYFIRNLFFKYWIILL